MSTNPSSVTEWRYFYAPAQSETAAKVDQAQKAHAAFVTDFEAFAAKYTRAFDLIAFLEPGAWGNEEFDELGLELKDTQAHPGQGWR